MTVRIIKLWVFTLVIVALGTFFFPTLCKTWSAVEAQATQPVTIFVHGTLPPLARPLVRWFDCPAGLTPAKIQGNKIVLGRVPYMVSKHAPSEFPLDSFYLFGWSGKLSPDARLDAAHELYIAIKKLGICGPIRIISHSHGCNVALLLAQMAKKHNDTTMIIDKLVLLACPVQKVTAHLAQEPIFKRVYSFYSTSDFVQVIDPQRMYQTAQKLKETTQQEIPFFSERIFPASPNLVQVRIKLNTVNPQHIHFMRNGFLQHLPQLINMLDANIYKSALHCRVDVLGDAHGASYNVYSNPACINA